MGISSSLGSSALLPAGLGFRNKLINGDMVIAQRGTSAVTGSSGAQYPVDRWVVFNSSSGSTVTFQQSSVVPAGFTRSLVATVTVAGSSNYTKINQYIEGSNVGDLSWGTAGGKPIVVSFWVRSSVVGTYTATVINSAINRTYISPFTVNVANTWEYKTMSIPADTSGTWLTTNGIGLALEINLGTSIGGLAGTPYVWSASSAFSVSGAVNFGTNAGATFYITGVQLEQNLQATPFEQRPIGVELALCQRYYEFGSIFQQKQNNDTLRNSYEMIFYKVTKRATPTTVTGTNSSSSNVSISTSQTWDETAQRNVWRSAGGVDFVNTHSWTASAELT